MGTTLPPAEALQLLHERRTALERAVRIAASVERMHHSLQAAMLMGKPAANIPQKMIDSLDRLDDTVKLMPSAKLKVILSHLEKEVQKRFSMIMELAKMDEAQLIDAEFEPGEDIEKVLLTYRKKAQTAVAVKVLLHSRGEITKPMPLPVPVADIRQQLGKLNEREQVCRKEVRNEIVVLIQETDHILTRSDLPEGMREIILATRQDFTLNLQHLDAGGTIITMPVGLEIVSMGDEHAAESSTEPQTPTAQEPTADEPPATTQDASATEATSKGRRPGMIYKLRRWVTTPFDVTWKDIEKELDEKYGDNKK
jgi:hypothetical protein